MLSLISALMLNDVRFMQWSFNSLNWVNIEANILAKMYVTQGGLQPP
jgi:hypothetical protein